MVNPLLAAAALAMLLAVQAAGQRAPAPDRAAPPAPAAPVSQMRIQQHIMIRVPRVVITARAVPAPPPAIEWKEKKGDKCVPMNQLAGYAQVHGSSVDLMLNGTQRIRARLDDDCPAIDFYSGFYIRRTADGMICADRDSIRSRAGGECQIESFRRLVPER